MLNQTDMIYVFWTCLDQEEAKKITRGLLDQRLIACSSIFPNVASIYRWNESIQESQEVKVILKTVTKHFRAVASYIQTHCCYDVPEIVQINIASGHSRYLDWVSQETLFQDPS